VREWAQRPMTEQKTRLGTEDTRKQGIYFFERLLRGMFAVGSLQSRSSPLALVCAIAAVTVLVAQPTRPSAQGKYVTPTAEQVELGEQALAAFVANDFDTAIARYQESLSIQPIDVTWITLGYALFAAGRCHDASEAYAKAADAPRLKPPPYPKQVDKMRQEYAAQLPERCGQVRLDCSTDDMTWSMDGGEPKPCPEGLTWIAAGSHEFVGRAGNGLERRAKLDVVAGSKARVELHVPDVSAKELARLRADGEELARGAVVRSTGIATLVEQDQAAWRTPNDLVIYTGAAGGTLLLTAIVLDLAWVGPAWSDLETASRGDTRKALADYDRLSDEFSSKQGVMQWVFGAGVLVTAAAATFHLLELGGEADTASAPAVGAWVGPEGGGMVFGGDF